MGWALVGMLGLFILLVMEISEKRALKTENKVLLKECEKLRGSNDKFLDEEYEHSAQNVNYLKARIQELEKEVVVNSKRSHLMLNLSFIMRDIKTELDAEESLKQN